MKIFSLLWMAAFICFPLAAQEMPQNPAAVQTDVYEESFSVTNAAGSGDTPQSNDSEDSQEKSQPDFFLETGIQYTEEGEYEEAERAYLRALKKDPENSSIRFRLSTLYLMMQRYKEAEPILKKLAEENPENAQVQNNLSWLYATGGEMKNSEKALRHAREAILSSPNAPSMWDTLAESYYVAGQYDKARRSAEHALDLLLLEDASEEQLRTFATQIIKIRRAQEAFKLFDGIDEE